MLVTAKTGTTFSVSRGFDGTTAVAHDPGKALEHCVCSMDYRDANAHIFDTLRNDHTQYLLKSLLLAKGSIYVATGSGIIAELPVGANGSLLTADSTVSAGIKWGGGVPTGSILMFGGSSVPDSSWYFLDGSVKTQAGDAGLFALVGTTFNTGGEAGTDFRLPDCRGRSIIGVGQGTSLTNRTRGQKGGTETHTLSIAQIPSHNHPIDMNIAGYDGGASAWAFFGNAFGPSHPSYDGPVKFTGGGQAHNIMHPWLALNYLIKR
jgi:microcystin-dependent protein